MEGRGVGQRGGELATEYIATQFALAGAKPAGENGIVVPDRTAGGCGSPQPDSTLNVAVSGKDAAVEVGRRVRRSESFAAARARALKARRCSWATASWRRSFSGTTIKGVDVTGKIVVLFTSEPTSTDPKFFDGRALTYYGRWTYKYEEALRHGAGACIIIHTTPTASYGWDVVRNSWGREEPYVKLPEGGKELSFAGWITQAAAEKAARRWPAMQWTNC